MRSNIIILDTSEEQHFKIYKIELQGKNHVYMVSYGKRLT